MKTRVRDFSLDLDLDLDLVDFILDFSYLL